jgi:hypothetical protein
MFPPAQSARMSRQPDSPPYSPQKHPVVRPVVVSHSVLDDVSLGVVTPIAGERQEIQ